jgi:hypothetical protein
MKTCRTGGEFLSSRGDPLSSDESKDNMSEDQIGGVLEFRTTLPALKPPDQKVSVWKVIKDAVGKDLSRFCVPVYFNEPISML